jgi:hypothetical protein
MHPLQKVLQWIRSRAGVESPGASMPCRRVRMRASDHPFYVADLKSSDSGSVRWVSEDNLIEAIEFRVGSENLNALRTMQEGLSAPRVFQARSWPSRLKSVQIVRAKLPIHVRENLRNLSMKSLVLDVIILKSFREQLHKSGVIYFYRKFHFYSLFVARGLLAGLSIDP